MIKVQFCYSKLTDIPNFEGIKNYEKKVNPLDYEYYLERGRYYNLWGVSITDTPSFFIDTGEIYQRIQLYPAVLFNKVDWSIIPKDWQICIDAQSQHIVEIFPSAFASIDAWFYRYLDEDPEVVAIVNRELAKVE